MADALDTLESAAQITKSSKGYALISAGTKVDTSEDPMRSRQLKATWTRVALQRLEAGEPGRFGYSVFAVSLEALRRIHQLHLDYVRAMRRGPRRR